ncbi:MAG: hypothetical protein EON93_24845, partial [Burkholderiales bacterium]
MDTAMETNDSAALIRNALVSADFFAHWSPDMLARVVQGAKLRRYERGEQVSTGKGSERQALMV